MDRKYTEYATDKALEVLAIDSPSGYTRKAAEWCLNEFAGLGFKSWYTTKHGVMVDFGGEDDKDAILLEAHVDTLGAMVAEIKSNGRLRLVAIGGLQANNTEAENVKLYTRDGKVYEGTIQLINASVHVNGEYDKTQRTWDSVELVLDEDVKSVEDVKALGISVGDIVCPDPRAHVTSSGYIKSRFLDDKLSVGILCGLAKYIADTKAVTKRKVYAHFTVYEEVGLGGAASVPEGVTEIISVDMGCVGEGIQCTEKQVSICALDSDGPYSYEVTSALAEAAKRAGADYVIDVYPHYSSDVEVTLKAGYDVNHGLIGAGVYASHGYERSHVDGVHNSLLLLIEYLGI